MCVEMIQGTVDKRPKFERIFENFVRMNSGPIFTADNFLIKKFT